MNIYIYILYTYIELYIYIYIMMYICIINMASSSIFGEYSDLFPTRDLKVGCRSAGGPGCDERGHYCGWIWGWCKTRNLGGITILESQPF